MTLPPMSTTDAFQLTMQKAGQTLNEDRSHQVGINNLVAKKSNETLNSNKLSMMDDDLSESDENTISRVNSNEFIKTSRDISQEKPIPFRSSSKQRGVASSS